MLNVITLLAPVISFEALPLNSFSFCELLLSLELICQLLVFAITCSSQQMLHWKGGAWITLALLSLCQSYVTLIYELLFILDEATWMVWSLFFPLSRPLWNFHVLVLIFRNYCLVYVSFASLGRITFSNIQFSHKLIRSTYLALQTVFH